MSIMKATLLASALSLAVVATAGAQGQEKTGPNGNYVPTPAPSAAMPAPVGQTPANGDYKNQPTPSGQPAPVGQTKANGDYQPTGK